ncbi:hypothetical protein HK102_003221 [Quaeritorhiza haematococci]|nr:hypothetical protein HK102_003221 [Quaeritorhiza haematococci]
MAAMPTPSTRVQSLQTPANTTPKTPSMEQSWSRDSLASLTPEQLVPGNKFQLVRNKTQDQLQQTPSTLAVAADNHKWKIVEALMYPLWEDSVKEWIHVLRKAVGCAPDDLSEALLDLGYRRAKGYNMPPNLEFYIPPVEFSSPAGPSEKFTTSSTNGTIAGDDVTTAAPSPPSSSLPLFTGLPSLRKKWSSTDFVWGWSEATEQAARRRSNCFLLRSIIKWGLKYESDCERSSEDEEKVIVTTEYATKIGLRKRCLISKRIIHSAWSYGGQRI